MLTRSLSIDPMTDTGLAPRRWGGLALRGVAAILLGLISVLLPGVAFMSLVIVFGAYAIIDGGIVLIDAARSQVPGRRSAVFRGLTSLVAGVLALAWPGISALVLVMVIAGWAMVAGIFEIATAIWLRKEITGEWLLALQGVLSILFGAAMAIAPFLGAIVIGLWVGSYALVVGGLMLALAFRLRKVARSGPGPAFAAA
ncbi:MAG TPA: HdeD family acid-resistance protein [Kofleriaceae bacterium]|nr:HdeD family acid-resistance protein [Kofleriaceae bacterium]